MNEEQLRNQIKKLKYLLLFETDPVKTRQMEMLVESLRIALDFEAKCNKEEKESEEDGLDVISVDEETEEESG